MAQDHLAEIQNANACDAHGESSVVLWLLAANELLHRLAAIVIAGNAITNSRNVSCVFKDSNFNL
jgi:hypothetical protein